MFVVVFAAVLAAVLATVLAAAQGTTPAHAEDLLAAERTRPGLRNDLASSSLSEWTAHAFAGLPCLDDLDFYEPNALLYNEFAPTPLTGRETILPSWKAFRSLVRDALLLAKKELGKMNRWPLDSADGYAQKAVDHLFGADHPEAVLPHVVKLLVPKDATVAFFGDLHGAIHSFIRELRALNKLGYLSDDLTIAESHRRDFFMVFNGDYVDRGIYGAEVMAVLLNLRLKNPSNVLLVRGNHEDRLMNDQPGSGGFTDELKRKFPGAESGREEEEEEDEEDLRRCAEVGIDCSRMVGSGPSSSDPFAVIWRFYESLPVALFLSTKPDSDNDNNNANASDTTAATVIKANGSQQQQEGDGEEEDEVDAKLKTRVKRPLSYIMAVHGGIEPGADVFPFLHQTRAFNPPSSPTADGEGQGEEEDQGGPVIQYAALRALRRADWVATRNETIRKRLTPAAIRKLENWGDDHHGSSHAHMHAHHHDLDLDHWPVSFARHRKEGGKYPARTSKVGRYPAALLETDPALGWCWNDFFVSRTGENGDNDGFLFFSEGRGFIFGRDLVKHWLEDNGIAAIFRAHQHNDSPKAGPMLTNVKKNQGMFDNWSGSGMVVTMLSGGHIPALGFSHDSFVLLKLGGEHSPKKWKLHHCRQRNGKQFIASPAASKQQASGRPLSSAPADWAWGRVPPADILELANNAAGRVASNFCDPDVAKAKCHLQKWSAGGWAPLAASG